MPDIAIYVEALGKRYRIGRHERYRTLRDTLTDAVTLPFRWFRNPGLSIRNSNPNHIWALKDISFKVKEGEVVGIIGRNGAGKSTLLKILSRITKPTEGYAKIHGRVGSLLEVGTGFHPELTGRENIYLNGAILGMKKVEIDRKFDEIVAFAELEKFIDTPVKHYSSGMHMRLAFAVAAHLEPEILLVDEVLAVGDAAFQKKCLGKMGDVAKGGRTVFLVSHQMNQIRRLCERCIWLDAGRVRKISATVEVISAYEAALTSISLQAERDSADDHVAARFLKWEIIDPHHEQSNVLATMGSVTLCFVLKVNRPIRDIHHGITLINSDGQLMWATAVNRSKFDPGIYELIYILPNLPIRPGIYQWNVSVHDENGLTELWNCIPEMVVATKPLNHHLDIWQGILNIPYEFHIK
jgi:lipopolysaccharide transport system ATP-binding protein